MTESEREFIANDSLERLCSLLNATRSTVLTLDSSGKSTKKIILTMPND